jgi:hypothetical protein
LHHFVVGGFGAMQLDLLAWGFINALFLPLLLLNKIVLILK